MLEVVRESVESMRQLLASFDPATVDGPQARELTADAAELERLAGALRTLAAGRVAETGAWVHAGDFRDAGAWMASITGTTVGRARATLETAERLTELPATEAALRSGSLSDQQVDAIAGAATADPNAEQRLLTTAATDGVKGLRTACARVEAAASTDQDERYERARVGRHLRHRRLSDVEGLIEMRGPIDRTAAVMAALRPYEREQFDEARGAERRELPETLAFDALVRLADDAASGRFAEAPGRAPATVVVRVDHSAFTRGTTEPGEVCEIAGVGPIPVSAARKLSSDPILKALITDGVDVRAISHLGRAIPARLRTALEELYPECAVAGCHVDRHLEIDHTEPVAVGGLTELANLTRLCPHHHDVKHARNLRLVGTGTDRRLEPPRRPPPQRAGERRVAA